MAGYTPTNATTFTTAGAVAANRIVKYHSVANQVVVATAATEKFAGITEHAATAADQELGVLNRAGDTAKVLAAGNISYGDYVTATTGGAAVATTTAAAFYVGIARQSAVSGDLFEVQIQLGQIADGT